MRTIVTLIYKPIGITAGIIAGLVSKRIFSFLWARVDDEDPPKANTEYEGLGKILAAAAFQGMVFKMVRAIVDRGTARAFYFLTGVWPGERIPDQHPDTA